MNRKSIATSITRFCDRGIAMTRRKMVLNIPLPDAPILSNKPHRPTPFQFTEGLSSSIGSLPPTGGTPFLD